MRLRGAAAQQQIGRQMVLTLFGWRAIRGRRNAGPRRALLDARRRSPALLLQLPARPAATPRKCWLLVVHGFLLLQKI